MAATGPGVNVPISNLDILEWRTVTVFGAQTGFNVRHFRVSGVGAPVPTLGDCATALNTTWAPLVKALLTAQATYRGIIVRRINPAPPSPSAWNIDSAGVGSVAGDAAPMQTAGVISIYTAFAGRKYRGRYYSQFPSETDNAAAAVPTAGYITNLTNIANGLLGIVVNPNAKVGTLTPVLWHRSTSTYTDLVGVTVRTVWGTQRKRGSFGRPNPSPI